MWRSLGGGKYVFDSSSWTIISQANPQWLLCPPILGDTKPHHDMMDGGRPADGNECNDGTLLRLLYNANTNANAYALSPPPEACTFSTDEPRVLGIECWQHCHNSLVGSCIVRALDYQ